MVSGDFSSPDGPDGDADGSGMAEPREMGVVVVVAMEVARERRVGTRERVEAMAVVVVEIVWKEVGGWLGEWSLYEGIWVRLS